VLAAFVSMVRLAEVAIHLGADGRALVFLESVLRRSRGKDVCHVV
jgi:hypothetical protein